MTVSADIRSSRPSKAVAVVVTVSALILSGAAVAGLLNGEFLGNVAFGMILASVGVSLAAAISLKAPAATFRMVRLLWVGWAVTVLLVGLLIGPGDGGATLIAYSMVATSFPVGLFAVPLSGITAAGLPPWLATSLIWAASAGMGYIQWFVALAKLRS